MHELLGKNETVRHLAAKSSSFPLHNWIKMIFKYVILSIDCFIFKKVFTNDLIVENLSVRARSSTEPISRNFWCTESDRQEIKVQNYDRILYLKSL